MSDPNDGGMQRVTVRIPEQVLADVEDAVDAGLYQNRSAAVVDALREKYSEPYRTRVVSHTTSGSEKPRGLMDALRGGEQ